jgi:hypothetical protein
MDIKEKLSSKNKNIQKVLTYVLGQVEIDTKLAQRVALDNKTVDKMWAYITGEARKLAVGNTAIVDDETVYGWAIHYFIEADTELKVETKQETDDETSNPIETPKKVIAKPEVEQLKLDI